MFGDQTCSGRFSQSTVSGFLNQQSAILTWRFVIIIADVDQQMTLLDPSETPHLSWKTSPLEMEYQWKEMRVITDTPSATSVATSVSTTATATATATATTTYQYFQNHPRLIDVLLVIS